MIRLSTKEAKAYGLHSRGLPKRENGRAKPRSQTPEADWPPFTIILPFPPSVNHCYPTRDGRRRLSKEGSRYHRDVLATVMGIELPDIFKDRLKLTIRLTMPDHRKRDIANYEKVLVDALTEAGVWLDDEQIDDLTISRGPVEKPGKAEVTIERMP